MRHETHSSQHPLTDLPASASPRNGTPGKYISTLLRLTAILLAATLTTQAKAQWDIEDSHTTASLRGIYNVGGGVAWASGANGTVIRTEDGGYLWQTCTIPPRAEKLDFRGIQAFDENTAIVMSSGPGDQSRLYKTTDGCQSWHLLFTNPDKEGFWDALKLRWISGLRTDGKLVVSGILIGDPVDGKFAEFFSFDGERWTKSVGEEAASARDGEGLFAASNSSLVSNYKGSIFVTGGKAGSRSRVLSEYVKHDPRVSWNFVGGDLPLASGDSAGAFSIATSRVDEEVPVPAGPEGDRVYFADMTAKYVAVGGDYKKPEKVSGTAAYSGDGGLHWKSAATPPHGYRSSVAYDPTQKLWITVGPNGTDISRDDGKNWQPLKPSGYDTPDTDKNWNALSLPFVVGPNGRIGKLRTITPTPPKP
jgi:photosystem II stability/assembly factor-like uncharacterized protein